MGITSIKVFFARLLGFGALWSHLLSARVGSAELVDCGKRLSVWILRLFGTFIKVFGLGEGSGLNGHFAKSQLWVITHVIYHPVCLHLGRNFGDLGWLDWWCSPQRCNWLSVVGQITLFDPGLMWLSSVSDLRLEVFLDLLIGKPHLIPNSLLLGLLAFAHKVSSTLRVPTLLEKWMDIFFSGLSCNNVSILFTAIFESMLDRITSECFHEANLVLIFVLDRHARLNDLWLQVKCRGTHLVSFQMLCVSVLTELNRCCSQRILLVLNFLCTLQVLFGVLMLNGVLADLGAAHLLVLNVVILELFFVLLFSLVDLDTLLGLSWRFFRKFS